jgi:protein TonB
MRKFGVLTVLALGWITASCAERMVHPAIISQPTPPKAASKPIPNDGEVRRRAETIAEKTRKRSAIRSRQVTPSAIVKPEQPPEFEAQPPQAPEQPPEAQTSPPPMATVLPPPLETDESNFPFAALMPPPPEPAEPTFPSASPIVELPPPLEPAVPVLPEVPIEAALPPPPEPAEPSFPIAALIPPPSEPAEPSLPSQEEVIIEGSIPIPFPDLASILSLRPQFDWVDTVGSIEVPHSPLSDAREATPEEGIPSLIRNPWPLPMEGS